MSNRISEAFAKGKAFIPFITCGDPSLEITEQLVYAMEEAGADLIELGIPFSDPTAEGPVIQEANVRVLSGGEQAKVRLCKLINRETGMPVYVAEYPLDCGAEGTGRILENLEKYRDLLTEEVRYY